jgi:hypothetical protein
MKKDDQTRMFTYLITSARGCVEEPPLYGTLRLLDAYSMLLCMLKREKADEFYFQLNERIEDLKNICMDDEKQFIEGLDRVLEILTDHIINQ